MTSLPIDGHLVTKCFFKQTDLNSYLSIHSGHHPTWIKNVPKGQFIRIRRNCTLDEDYTMQAQVLKNRFVEKGYNTTILDKTINDVQKVPQRGCLG